MTDQNDKNIPADAENNPAEGNNPAEQENPYVAIRMVEIGVVPGYMLRKVGQAYMVMPTGPRMKDYQGMITLNETGAFLFKESQKENPTKETLIEACKAEYGATDEEALQAVDSFVMQCAECGLFKQVTKYFEKATGKEVSADEFEQ